MAKKKEFKCLTCEHYDGENCTHPNNIAIKVKYRQETEFFVKTPEELNPDGKCKDYAKI